MIRSVLATALFAGMISSAYSVNVIHHFEALKNKQHMKASSAAVHTPKVARNYTDFSGTWQGVCNFDGEQEEDTMTIESNEDYIALDDEVYFMNMMKTESIASNEGVMFNHGTVNWSDDGSKLKFKFIDIDKDYTLPLSQWLNVSKWSMTLSLDEGALIIQAHIDHKDDKMVFGCKMNKVDGPSAKPVAINRITKQ